MSLKKLLKNTFGVNVLQSLISLDLVFFACDGTAELPLQLTLLVQALFDSSEDSLAEKVADIFVLLIIVVIIVNTG